MSTSGFGLAAKGLPRRWIAWGSLALIAGIVAFSSSVARAAPANDAFASAQGLSGDTPTANGTTVGATLEAGEPAHESAGKGSAWYSWTPAHNVKVTIDTCSPGQPASPPLDPEADVYTGSAVNALTAVTLTDRNFCGDFGSSVPGTSHQFTAVAGTTYRISVIQAFVADGGFTLNVSAAEPPANDDFDNAQQLSGDSPDFKGTTVAASEEPGEPGATDGGASVWYRWTAPRDSRVDVDVCKGTGSENIEVFTGGALASLKSVGSTLCTDNDPRGSDLLKAKKGTTYRIQVRAEQFALRAPFELGFIGAVSDISIKLSASAKHVAKGKTVTYSAQINNRGTVPYSNDIVLLTTKLNKLGGKPPKTKYVAIKGTHIKCKHYSLYGIQPAALCKLVDLAPGASASITAKVRLSGSISEWAYQAKVDDDDPANDNLQDNRIQTIVRHHHR